MHGYYTNKFIIISCRRSRMFSAKYMSIIQIMPWAYYSIKRMSFHLSIRHLHVFSNCIHHILSVPPFRPLAIHFTSPNCHVALCPNHLFCRCLTTVNKHPFSPTYKALQNSFICQCSYPANMLYILRHGHIPNTSNLFKMYMSVFGT